MKIVILRSHFHPITMGLSNNGSVIKVIIQLYTTEFTASINLSFSKVYNWRRKKQNIQWFYTFGLLTYLACSRIWLAWVSMLSRARIQWHPIVFSGPVHFFTVLSVDASHIRSCRCCTGDGCMILLCIVVCSWSELGSCALIPKCIDEPLLSRLHSQDYCRPWMAQQVSGHVLLSTILPHSLRHELLFESDLFVNMIKA